MDAGDFKRCLQSDEGEGITRKEGKRRKTVMARPRAAAPTPGSVWGEETVPRVWSWRGGGRLRIRCGRVGSGRSWENLCSNREEGSLSPGGGAHQGFSGVLWSQSDGSGGGGQTGRKQD